MWHIEYYFINLDAAVIFALYNYFGRNIIFLMKMSKTVIEVPQLADSYYLCLIMNTISDSVKICTVVLKSL